MSLSEVVHTLDKMIYLNYEIIEDVENEMGKYGYKRNPSHSPTRASESLSFQDYNTSDEVAKSNGMFQQSFNTQYQRNYHGHRSFTILSPLEEEDESLLNEDDEVGIVQSSPMIQTGNGTPRTPTMESLGLRYKQQYLLFSDLRENESLMIYLFLLVLPLLPYKAIMLILVVLTKPTTLQSIICLRLK